MSRIGWLLSVCAFMCCSAAIAGGEDTAGDRAAAVKFLKDHVDGKTLVSPEAVLRGGGGKVEAVSSNRVRFCNFTETKSGFSFDAQVTIKQTVFDVGEDGKRQGSGRNHDRSFTWRYQVGQRRSTNQLIGVAVPVDDKGNMVDAGDPPFSAYSVRIRMADGKLIVSQSSVLHDDLFAKGGQWRPGAIEIDSEFVVRDGRLERTVKAKGYDVDPRTGEKKLSDTLPDRVEKQVDEKAEK